MNNLEIGDINLFPSNFDFDLIKMENKKLRNQIVVLSISIGVVGIIAFYTYHLYKKSIEIKLSNKQKDIV